MPDGYFSFETGKAVLQKIYSDRNAEEIRTSLNWDVEISSTLERINPPSNTILEGANIFLQNN